MAGAKGALVVNIVADASKAVRAFKGTGDAGKDMATQLNMAADRMERDLENTQKIADELAKHLGPKFKTTVGDNIDDIAAQFNRAGLKIEDVQGNMPGLVQGLKRVEAQAEDTADEMTRIGKETDKTGSVMANFTGNAVQEIPGLSDAFGPLNTAIGQFAEYATEGNIKLSSLLKTGLMMGGIGLVFAGISAAMDRMAKAQERVKVTAEAAKSAQEALADSKYREAAQALYEAHKTLYKTFGEAGVEASVVTQALMGNSKAADKANKAYAEYVMANYSGNMEAKRTAINLMTDSLNQASTAWDETAASTKADNIVLDQIASSLGWTTSKTDELATANTDAATAVWGLYEAQLGLINLQLGKRGAERNYRRALEEYNKVNADSTATEDQKAEALDNVELAALSLAQATGDLAEANGTVADGANAQIEVLKGLAQYLAPGSELRNNLQGYADDLLHVAKIEALQAQLTEYRNSDGAGYPANYGSMLMSALDALTSTGYAMGTMNAQAGLALVGENGPELIDFGGGERVYNNAQTGAILDGGGNSITINMPAGADGDDIVLALQRWVRRNGQIPLPITADQRR